MDTRPIVAAANRSDPHPDRCVELLRAGETLIVSPLVMAESCYLIHKYGGAGAEAMFLRFVTGQAFRLEALTVGDVERMTELVDEYADLRLGATDASVVA